jgi:hypothetical protein
MKNFKLEFYFKGNLQGSEVIQAFDKKEARAEAYSFKMSFSLKLRDEEDKVINHRKISVKIVPSEEAKEKETKSKSKHKSKLEDVFKHY